MTRWILILTVSLTCVLSTGPQVALSETTVLPEGAPWRVFLTCAQLKKHSTEAEGFTANPPADWASPDFDASGWGRYGTGLDHAMGGYGSEQSPDRAMICLRTGFGVSDPSGATDLTLTCPRAS